MEDFICKKCKVLKPKSDFQDYKHLKRKHDNTCKGCRSKATIIRKRTREGLLLNIYNTQKCNSRRRKYSLPNYTKEEFLAWGFKQTKFEELYINWVNSNFDLYKRPSADRLDDYKPYTLDNLRLVTWKTNRLKYFADVKSGKNKKVSRAVCQYDLDGNFIKEFYSITQASREGFGTVESLWCSAKRESKSTNGFQWKFYKSIKINPIALNYVYQFSMEGKFISRFKSSTQAYRAGFGTASGIFAAARDSRVYKSKYIWSFNKNLTHEQAVNALTEK